MKLSTVIDKLPRFMRNKYLFTIAIFALWLLFFDKTNIISWLSEEGEIHTMKREKAYYEEQIKSITTQLNELRTNNESLEKFAREHYFFKEEGEDIFLIEE